MNKKLIIYIAVLVVIVGAVIFLIIPKNKDDELVLVI